MCDIWKDNANVRSLNLDDVKLLIQTFRLLQTKWVVMSGGEALMNRKLFELCELLRTEGIKITILSTGLLLKKFAKQVVRYSDEVIVSLDGSKIIHNEIRRVPKAYQKLQAGIIAVKNLQPNFSISGRGVIQRMNIADWPNIINSAHDLELNQISFLAADISTDAFNRPNAWQTDRQSDILPLLHELPKLQETIEAIIIDFAADFETGFIAEKPAKLRKIYDYYAAFHQQQPFPVVRCNAPWVSTVIEADGTVRPCFFHAPIGNIHDASLIEVLNQPEAIKFRSKLNISRNDICRKCVCTLNLPIEI